MNLAQPEAVARAARPSRGLVWLAVALAAGVLGLAALLVPRVAAGGVWVQPFWAVPSLGITGGLRVDGLALVFVLLISGIGALVFLYAGAYKAQDPRLPRLMLILLLFMGAMLGTVAADDVITLFIFWELTSLTSYFLVGYDHEDEKARRAALQALLVTAGGGLALLAGLILVAIAAGTTSISGILAQRDAVLVHPASGAAMLLILAGAFTKSAQVPFHFWLPNAMAAPTPVSAYLHSATMVKLGVYLVARIAPLYEGVALWHGLLIGVGLATAATAALLALRETDLKRVLAYTTVTALGTLVMLVGLATPLAATAAVTFLVVHALYKASLFLIAGIVDQKTGLRDASALGGLARAMPLTAGAAVLAALSMAGLPPFVGFVAKELLYEATLASATAPLFLTSGLVAVKIVMVAIAAVLGWRLFFGRRLATPRVPADPPFAMLAGPALLAVLGLMVGAAPGLLGELFVYRAASAIHPSGEAVLLKLWHGLSPVLGLSVLTVAAGVALYLGWPRIVTRLRAAGFIERYGAARGYDALLAGVLAGAAWLTAFVQHGSLRGYLRLLFSVAGLGMLATLLLTGGVALPPPGQVPIDVRVLALACLVLGALATATASRILVAVIASGLAGFSAAMIFLLFGAPDVALTQFAVETLLVAMLAAVLVRLPISQHDRRPSASRLTDGTIALATGAAVTLVVLAVLATPFDPRLSAWYGAESVPSGYGRNVVNVILVDFRALDTLGEIAVLAFAAIAVAALLRRRSSKLVP